MESPPTPLKHEQLTEKIIGIFYDVYNELGYGFLESIYEESLVIALKEAGLEVENQVPVPVWFRHHKVGEFRVDVLVENTNRARTEERESDRGIS
jgi:GxxExxY protein